MRSLARKPHSKPWYSLSTPSGVDITTNNRNYAWACVKKLWHKELVVVKRDGVEVWRSHAQATLGL